MIKPAAFAVLLFAAAWPIDAGCSAPLPPGAATAAESAYTAALLRCVDTARTLAESRECRRKVNLDWAITEVQTNK